MNLQKDQHDKLRLRVQAVWPHLSVFQVLPDLEKARDAGEMFFEQPKEKTQRPGPGIELNSRGRERMAELVLTLRGFLKDRVTEKVVKKQVVDWLKDIFIRNNWTKPELSTEHQIELVDRVLQTDGPVQDYILTSSVCGAVLPAGPFSALGMVFVPANHSGLLQGFELLGFPLNRVPDYLANQGDKMMRDLAQTRVLCMVRTTGHEIGAGTNNGLMAARDTLGVFNLVMHWTRFWDCRVSLLADDLVAHRVMLAVGREHGCSHPHRVLGRADHRLGALEWPLSHEIHNERLTTPWAAQVNDVFRKFAANETTEFERQLVRMWAWLGRSYMSRDLGEKFLFNVVALECGLGLVKGDGKRKTLSWFAALLLENDEQNREFVRNRVLRWYDARSSIVHAGSAAPSEVDCTAAEEAIIRLAQTLTVRRAEWSSAAELHTSLNGQLPPRL